MNTPSATVDDRYTRAEIRRYEAIFGRHFISPGGLDSTRQFLELVELDPGSSVLDVGCGIGGSAFYMARTFGCCVDGIDLSTEMIRIARERLQEEGLESFVRFFQGDCLTFQYPREDYRLIHSRDVFLHIKDKLSALAIFRQKLHPAGHLLFTDYIRGIAAPSDEFQAYVRQHEYSLETLDSYGKLLRDAGFSLLRADDLTDMFLAVLKQELDKVPHAGLSPEDTLLLQERWKRKILWADRREQGWALFLAKRGE